MFTVLSNIRNSNLYLVAALVIMVIVLLTLAIAPSISLGSPVTIPVTGVQSNNLEFRRGEWTAGASVSGYEQIEALRVERVAPSAAAYDLIEQLRVGRGIGADRSYDNLELVRATHSVLFPAIAGYDALEQLRLGRGSKDAYALIEALRIQNTVTAFSSASGYDLVEQMRLARSTEADHSYDSIEAIRLQR